MPTEFYQDGATDYRTALAAELDERVQVAWTGVGVVPKTITGRELAGARAAFRRPLVTMDNYPVNDYAQDRIFLGPYTGRDPAVAGGSAALLSNAMEQPSASRIPLFTAADFAWNPKAYRPQESWRAAIADWRAATPPRGRPWRRWRATAPPLCWAATSPRTSGLCCPRSGRRVRPRTRRTGRPATGLHVSCGPPSA